MRTALVTGLMVASLMGVGLGLAAPAAATTLADNGGGSVTVSGIGGVGDVVLICASPTPAADCSALLASAVLASINQNGTYSEGSTVILPTGLAGPLAAGTYTMVPITGFVAGAALLNVVITGGGGAPSSSETSSQPRSVTLSLNTADDSSCRQSSASGFAGSWTTLPGADDCTASASMPSATLLGWATTPNFPVDIAQRQVSNGWGAYEMFNDNGHLTAVFIPAGGATFLSGDGNLFAIWGG